MLSHFVESFTTVFDGVYMGINSGFDKALFINPIIANSKIRDLVKVLEIKENISG